MNKLVRTLLSGASLATLQLCAVSAARASAPLVINGATGAVTVTAGQSPDYIQVTGTGDISGDLTNEGSVDIANGSDQAVLVQGGAIITGNIVNATGGVIGGKTAAVLVIDTASIGGLVNDGQILVGTTKTNGFDHAFAIGYNSNAGVATITNNGSVSVGVKSLRNGAEAEGYASGIFENVSGSGNNVASYTGTGSVGLNALASAVHPNASASAGAYSAIKQNVSGGNKNTATIDNSGALTLSANAQAIATGGQATAKAFAGSALGQIANHSAKTYAHADILRITNSGNLALGATALAKAQVTAKATAKATAKVSDVFKQHANNAQSIREGITNSGALTLNAVAKATGTAETKAKATARIDDVFQQSAKQSGSHGGAITQKITNSGNLTINATATAIGLSSDYARAAIGYVFEQSASYADTLKQTISNSGSLTLNLAAHGSEQATDLGYYKSARAHAGVGHIFDQSGTGYGSANSTITQAITNSGNISIAAAATEAAASQAEAAATASKIFFQEARDVLTATQAITNSGSLAMSFAATAHGMTDTGYVKLGASAHAGASQLFGQTANLEDLTGASITQTITNSGDIGVTAVAKATASAFAVANASVSHVFSQKAHGAATVAQSITNSGSLAFSLKAAVHAPGTDVGYIKGFPAHATVKMTDLFHQVANATGANGTTSQTITNNGSVTISGKASIAGGDVALATAKVLNLAYQSAYDAGNITQTIDNSGALSIKLRSVATATGAGTEVRNPHYGYNYFANATAKAGVNGLFRQYADVEGDSAIAQSITNSGNLSIAIAATAVGESKAKASAWAYDVFRQEAYNADTIGQSITNSGALKLGVKASAKATGTGTTHKAYASAQDGVWDVFSQYAAGDNANGSTISQTVTNNGSLSIGVAATALAETKAKAQASAGDIFQQRAYSAGSVSQTITNSGTIKINLSASAKGKDYVSAKAATSDLFAQYVSIGSGSIGQTLDLTNSGALLLGLKANATATGASREALARAQMNTAVKQTAKMYPTTAQTTGSIVQSITNDGTISIAETATAKGLGAAYAEATASKLFKQYAERAPSISQSLSNTGAIAIQQVAKATGASNAGASATLKHVISQNAGTAYSIDQSVTNSGSISVTGTADATGGTGGRARAGAGAIGQQATYVDVAALTASNAHGTIGIAETAHATGTRSAAAYAWAGGVSQYIDPRGFNGTLSAHIAFSNSGTIGLSANASAKGGLMVHAQASATGASQDIQDIAGKIVAHNTGTMSVTATASGQPGTPGTGVTATTTRLPYVAAEANGEFARAYGQNAVLTTNGSAKRTLTESAPLNVRISNSGTLNVAATANGSGLGSVVIAAVAEGMGVWASSKLSRGHHVASSKTHRSTGYMTTYGGGTVTGSVTNSGAVSVSASADGGAAFAGGIVNVGGDISATVTNTKHGTIDVAATGAMAFGVGIGEAGYFYSRSNQYHRTGTSLAQHTTWNYHTVAETRPATTVSGNITNDGTIDVTATNAGTDLSGGSNLTGGEGRITLPPVTYLNGADAEGIYVNGLSVTANIANGGAINVTAMGRSALANGIHVLAQTAAQSQIKTEHRFYTSVEGFHYTTQHQTNWAQSTAEGSSFSGQVSNSGTIDVTAKGAHAQAKGVNVNVDAFDGSVVNTGTIDVTASGSGASAIGIYIDPASVGANAYVENDGTINARYRKNGAYWRGTAIDVSQAGSALPILLYGGSIYGNIVENAAGNAVTVAQGNTILDGLINPSKSKVGSLNIASGGTLTLANNAAEGNASAYVATFTQHGTLAINGDSAGNSGSIHAGSASLGGAAIVNLDLTGQPYGASTTYRVVFSDAALSGTWASVAASADTTFFNASGVYSSHEADITLNRVAFNDITGLTPNEESVSTSLETIYDSTGGTGSLGSLYKALFGLTPSQYINALDALSGIPIGELEAANAAGVQSFLDMINNHLAGSGGSSAGGSAMLTSPGTALASNLAPSNVAPAQIDNMSGTNVWGGGFQYGSSVARTVGGPGYNTHQSGLLAGVDVPVSRNVLFGVAGSYGSGDLKTEANLGYGRFSSAQIAGYGRFIADNGLYAMGDVSYASFKDKLTRYITIPGLGSGSTHGDFDSHAWGLYGEAGWHFNPSGWSSSVTPYAAVSYQDASSNGYTETGSFIAPLTITGVTSRATSSYLGVKLATDWQVSNATVTPRLTAAWQHDFTGKAWEVNAAFTSAPTVGFGLNGTGISRDSAYVDGGFTVSVADSVDILLDYQGRFNSDRTDGAFLARANFKFW